MICIGIDVGKFKHCACVVNDKTGEILNPAFFFENNKAGFELLLSKIKPFRNRKHMVGMEDTGHYGNNLVQFLLDQKFSSCLINPRATFMRRKALGQNAKTDPKDALLIAEMISDTKVRRVVTKSTYKYASLRELTRIYHQLKEQQNQDKNKLQRALDIVFPEVNTLPWTRCSQRYNRVLKSYPSAARIAATDIRTLRNVLDGNGRGRRCALSAEVLKDAAKSSIGDKQNIAVELQVQALLSIIEAREEQFKLIEQKIEELARQLNSPITSIPGVGLITGMTILGEIGDIENYDSAAKIVSFAGLDPGKRQSGTFDAQHLPISKQGSRYLRKALYQAVLTVVNNEPTFQSYFKQKESEGKIYRCAQGHVARKLIRVIYKLLSTNTVYNPELIK